MMPNLRIVMAGGGSGGHVTPLLSVARELQSSNESLEITFITDRSFFRQTTLLTEGMHIRTKKIYAGKYRRYHGKSFLWHLTHLPTVLKNVRDIFLLILGTIQSGWYFLLHRPDVVFCKGGFVCVPVGIMAHLWCVPLIIHDSDTHPGLTNRFLARWAAVIATGMPAQYYQYPAKKMMYTGIPVNETYHPASTKAAQSSQKAQGAKNRPQLLVTGGGTGAKSLNDAIVTIAPQLLENGWEITHFTGKGKGSSAKKAHALLPADLNRYWRIIEFADIGPHVLAADVIVSRAGATAMQEFANAQKTVILVPNPHLTGGHQLKNAAMFADEDAVVVVAQDVVSEAPEALYGILRDLQYDDARRKKLAKTLHQKFAKPRAAAELAAVILQYVKNAKVEKK